MPFTCTPSSQITSGRAESRDHRAVGVPPNDCCTGRAQQHLCGTTEKTYKAEVEGIPHDMTMSMSM